MVDLEEVDRYVDLSREFRRSANVTECIMNRDIYNKNHFRYHSSFKNRYSNPYQLYESVLPIKSASLDLNQTDEREDGPYPDDLSICLGFSPDGRYLAFQTDCRNSLTICHYNGVEGVNPDSEKSFRRLEKTQMFASSEVFKLDRLHNYRPATVLHNWWTDDSSTLIVVFRQEKKPAQPNPNGQNTIDIYARANRLEEMSSMHWNYKSHAPEHDVCPRPKYTMENPPRLDDDPDFSFSDEEESSGSEPSDAELGGNGSELDKMMACLSILHSELHHAPQMDMFRDFTPFKEAVYSLAEDCFEYQEGEQCSRTLNVYHNYLRSASLDESRNYRTAGFSPSPYFEIWARRKHDKEARHPPTPCGYRRPIVPYPFIRRAHRWKRPKKFDPTGLFQKLREETEVVSEGDYVSHKTAADKRRVFLIVAYNLNTGKISPLRVVNERGKFHVNMNNRRLTVVSNGDFIETFKLRSKDNIWEQIHPARLSTSSFTKCPIRYRTDTRPGYPVRFGVVVSGDPLSSLFEMSAFHSPIVQDSKTLLYRDQLDWFLDFQNIRVDIPVITRCHTISRSLMAVTITYLLGKSKYPLHHGVVVDLNRDAVMLYPNYTEFLQLLFKNHMADMFPRSHTYLSPHPVHLQDWFPDFFVDVHDEEEMNHYSRMKSAYDLMYERLKNNRGFANPLYDSRFYSDGGLEFMSNYLHLKGDTSVNLAHDWQANNQLIYTEKWFHPFDPLYVFKSLSIHFARVPKKAPPNVIEKEGEEPMEEEPVSREIDPRDVDLVERIMQNEELEEMEEQEEL